MYIKWGAIQERACPEKYFYVTTLTSCEITLNVVELIASTKNNFEEFHYLEATVIFSFKVHVISRKNQKKINFNFSCNFLNM